MRTQPRNDGQAGGLGLGRWSLLWLLLPLLGWAPLAADEANAPVKREKGHVDVKVKPAEKTPPDDPEAAKRITERASGVPAGDLDWHATYVADPDGSIPPAAAATLAVARDPSYDRKQAVHDLTHGGKAVQPLIRKLDVGRHELLKVLYHRAMVLANKRLQDDGRSPLQRVQAVNAGGTGDYTRDQDITVFVDDPERERYFFEAVEEVAKSPDIGLKVDVKPTGGIDFPEIEVTFFRGSNDLPDARFATDVEKYALSYMRAIANQAADKEAYKGGGADIEVKGRRVPGQMYVQQLTWEGGKPVYVAETPQNFREGRSLFSGTAPERWQRFERAAHIFSDFIQGRQHSEGAGHEPTKGPLKYAGRAIEHFCLLHGMRPWPELAPADRLQLLAKVWPQFDPRTTNGSKVLGQIADALDIAVHVKSKKEMRPGTSDEAAAKAELTALKFLRHATGATLSRMAQDLLNPPAFDVATMRKQAGPEWDRMKPIERFRFAQQKDEVFRRATSRASMENLLVAVSLLRTMDFKDGVPQADRPGEQMIAKMMAQAPPEMRPLLGLASEFAEAWAQKQQTSDPKVWAQCDRQLAELRARIVVHCPLTGGGVMPGEALLRKAAAAGPRAVLQAESRPGRSWLSGDALEVKQAFDEHLKAAFPSHAEQWRQFRADMAEMGMKTYVARRMLDEAFQWDTVADALTLVEMYQQKAGWEDYGRFLGINLVSRVHWGVGPLIQAVGVYDTDPEEAAKKAAELGKSVVFMTLSRVVPWAASAKIAFDVLRGTVVVTVGWAIGQANAEAIDAAYTGDAGRTSPPGSGPARPGIRDAGVAVVPASFVRRITDPKTGDVQIVVDRDALWLSVFRRWTEEDPDEVPRLTPPKGFVKAHDDFVALLLRQAEQHGPTWVQEPGRPFFPTQLTEKDVEAALRALEPQLRERATAEAHRVADEIGLRGYRSYMDAEGTDVIRDGLARRYCADLLAGLIEHWQVRITAQILAARELERTAVYQDFAAIAAQLHERYVPSATRLQPLEMRIQGGRLRAVRREGGATTFVPIDPADENQAGLTFEVKASVDGVPVMNGAALDGSEPVHVSASLEGRGVTGDDEKAVKMEITTQKLKKVRTAGAEDDDTLRPGDLAEDTVLIRALAADGAGPELARKEITLRVLVPAADATRRVPLYEYELRRRDGTLRERYVYAESFYDMPPEWVSESGEVYHGLYEVFHGDGSTRAEVRRYHFGVLHGKLEFFDSQGRLVHDIPYDMGKRDGDQTRYDPESSGRLVVRWERDRVTEERSSHASGAPRSHITYAYADAGEGRLRVTGNATQWWSNGSMRWTGRHERTGQPYQVAAFEDTGGLGAQSVGGKVGTWVWWHENGQKQEQTEYVAGAMQGAHQTWDEKGRPVAQGAHDRGAPHGRWTAWAYTQLTNAQGEPETRVDRSWTLFDHGRVVERGFEDDK